MRRKPRTAGCGSTPVPIGTTETALEAHFSSRRIQGALMVTEEMATDAIWRLLICRDWQLLLLVENLRKSLIEVISLSWVSTFPLGPFWGLGSLGLVCKQGGLISRQYHLRVLLRLEKPMPTQVSSTLSPPLSSSPQALVSILNMIWKKLFKCRKNSILKENKQTKKEANKQRIYLNKQTKISLFHPRTLILKSEFLIKLD